VAAVFCLGTANVVMKADSWPTFEDGVFWHEGERGVMAGAIAAKGASAKVVRPGDLLLLVDGQPVDTVDEVWSALQRSGPTARVVYTIYRSGDNRVITAAVTPARRTPGFLYFVLAAVGLFTLLVGGAVRLRRPEDPATLHFFWLAVAFCGVLTFSFIGSFSRLDWFFYWADAVATLAMPPLLLHFMLVFPERPRPWRERGLGRLVVTAAYVPAVALGLTRAAVLAWADPVQVEQVIRVLDRADYLYLAVCLLGGLAGLTGAFPQDCSITARRQLRWILWGTALGGVPFALFCALPYALGYGTTLGRALFAIPLAIVPLAYASAIVRYRLLDIEVIVKRSVVYAAALCAIVLIYAGLLQVAPRIFRINGPAYLWIIALLATLVAVLLAPAVKSAVQTLLDRAFYRDRYDYRRALVGFARDLNSDLDLNRLADRLVSRVVETLLVDRMALMLESDAGTEFCPVRASGFDVGPSTLGRDSGIGARLTAGHVVALDDPLAIGRFAVEEIESWRDTGLYYFVPCMANEKAIAVLALGRKATGGHLNSEDMELLSAVAGQIATALENAQLYRQLQLKAVEFDRLRTFNEDILESLDDGLLVFDRQERVLRWNRAMGQLYGVASHDATGRGLDELFDAPFVEAIRAARRDAPDGAILSRVPLAARGGRSGTNLILNASAVPLRASEGAAAGIVGTIVIVEDITGRVQLEEQLQISEKMASIGLLAAGVAHEVNTPLTGISSFTQMLLEGADPEDPRTRLLEKIERQTFRAARIVNGLLNLSRPAEASTERMPIDVNLVIADVLTLLEHQFATHRIMVRRELAEEPPVVLGMEHKLQQVFLNLFLNAKDAMPKGGWLSVRTRMAEGRVIAEVADTGSGIPNEHLTRIYDPFFTTKVIGQGTGLGLSITYGIVREHEGTIDCESAVGQGTRFVLALPVAAARPAAPARRQTGVR
jgi:PAS domain S-box-containing protein